MRHCCDQWPAQTGMLVAGGDSRFKQTSFLDFYGLSGILSLFRPILVSRLCFVGLELSTDK